MLSGPERKAIDRIVNASRESITAPPTVVAQFLDWAAKDPDAPAVIDQERTFSYGDVERITRSIAGGITPGSRVGIALNRSPESVLAMLGVMRAGAAYVPIDPSWPIDRIAFIVGDSQLDLVIGSDHFELNVPTKRLDDLVAQGPESTPSIQDGDLAYILYTSGSTGRPKGVMIEHGALTNYVSWASRFYDQGQRLTFPLFTALTFDLTVTSVFVPLVSGGAIRVYGDDNGRTDLSIL